MNAGSITGIVVAGFVGLVAFTYWGTYNGFQKKDETVKAAERQIASCYQKRSDLFGNLQATVERFSKQEKEVVIGNAQVRAGVGSIKLPDNTTPDQLREFMESQKGMGSAISRLLAVAEAVPNMASSSNFLSLQKDIKQTENQCNMLRNRYIQTVQSYNSSIRTFPSNIVANMHGYTSKQQLTFDDEQQNRQTPRLFR
jgi:LemA protein